jgi:hypothetical protein
MIQRTLALLGAVAFAAFCSSALIAQNSQPSPATQPAPSAQAASALPSLPAPQDPSASNSPSVPTAQEPAKKVWTNDDLGDLRDNSPVSTVGSTNSNSGRPASKSAPSARNKDARPYRDQIARLQAQIPPLDMKINELQSALAGNPVTETRHLGGVRPDDWKDQLARLQVQRDGIQAKIVAIEDEARHRGAPSNQIP